MEMFRLTYSLLFFIFAPNKVCEGNSYSQKLLYQDKIMGNVSSLEFHDETFPVVTELGKREA